jgi:hypothetical protein
VRGHGPSVGYRTLELGRTREMAAAPKLNRDWFKNGGMALRLKVPQFYKCFHRPGVCGVLRRRRQRARQLYASLLRCEISQAWRGDILPYEQEEMNKHKSEGFVIGYRLRTAQCVVSRW